MLKPSKEAELVEVENESLASIVEVEEEEPKSYDSFKIYQSVKCFPLASFIFSLNITEVNLIIVDLNGK